MSVNLCLKEQCPNWGTLVIDTNLIIYMLDASVTFVEENSIHTTWAQRLPEVLCAFNENLDKLKKCSFNTK